MWRPGLQHHPDKIVEIGGKFERPGEFCKRLRGNRKFHPDCGTFDEMMGAFNADKLDREN